MKYTLFIGVVIGIISWTIYESLKTGLSDIAGMFGITNIHLQNLFIIFTLVLILVVIFRKNIWRVLKSALKR